MQINKTCINSSSYLLFPKSGVCFDPLLAKKEKYNSLDDTVITIFTDKSLSE